MNGKDVEAVLGEQWGASEGGEREDDIAMAMLQRV